MAQKQTLIIIGLMIVISGFIIYQVIGCAPDPPPPDDCKVPDILYMCDAVNSGERNSAEVKNELLLAAENDLEIVNQGGKLSNLATIDRFYEVYRDREYCVSRAFYQAYKSRRNAICTYFVVVRDSTMSPSTRMKAEIELLSSILELRSIPITSNPDPDTTEDTTTAIDERAKRVKREIEQLRDQKVKLEKLATQVDEGDKPIARALVDNCGRVIGFLENDHDRLEQGEITEEYFWRRFEDLKLKFEEYKKELESL